VGGGGFCREGHATADRGLEAGRCVRTCKAAAAGDCRCVVVAELPLTSASPSRDGGAVPTAAHVLRTRCSIGAHAGCGGSVGPKPRRPQTPAPPTIAAVRCHKCTALLLWHAVDLIARVLLGRAGGTASARRAAAGGCARGDCGAPRPAPPRPQVSKCSVPRAPPKLRMPPGALAPGVVRGSSSSHQALFSVALRACQNLKV
jgi:hypothetical protein